jgi:hypothetical protein
MGKYNSVIDKFKIMVINTENKGCSSSSHCYATLNFLTSIEHIKLYSKVVFTYFMHHKFSDMAICIRRLINYVNKHSIPIFFRLSLPCSLNKTVSFAVTGSHVICYSHSSLILLTFSFFLPYHGDMECVGKIG